MSLPSLLELEESIGGRPSLALAYKKSRMSFYLNNDDAVKLKAYAIEQDTTVSKIVRNLLKPLVNGL